MAQAPGRGWSAHSPDGALHFVIEECPAENTLVAGFSGQGWHLHVEDLTSFDGDRFVVAETLLKALIEDRLLIVTESWAEGQQMRLCQDIETEWLLVTRDEKRQFRNWSGRVFADEDVLVGKVPYLPVT